MLQPTYRNVFRMQHWRIPAWWNLPLWLFSHLYCCAGSIHCQWPSMDVLGNGLLLTWKPGLYLWILGNTKKGYSCCSYWFTFHRLLDSRLSPPQLVRERMAATIQFTTFEGLDQCLPTWGSPDVCGVQYHWPCWPGLAGNSSQWTCGEPQVLVDIESLW